MKASRPKKLYDWQRQYASNLCNVLRTRRVALVQLPTGAGKTAVVLAALAKMRTPPDRIIVGMPRRPHGDDPWSRDVQPGNFSLGSKQAQSRLADGRLEVVSHRDLSRSGYLQLMRYRRGQKASRGFSSAIGRSTVVILDEVHRAKRLLSELERFRPIGRKKSIKLILVSATPVNPVRINDARATAELSERHLDQLEDKAITTGYLRLYKALTCVAREGDVESLEKAESLKDVAQALAGLERQLKPIPRIRQMRRHRAPATPTQPKLARNWIKANTEDILEATKKLVEFASVTELEGPGLRRATAERFAIAGCLSNSIWKKSLGKSPFVFPNESRHAAFYGEYASDALLRRKGVALAAARMQHKLVALEHFLHRHFQKGASAGRVLVFCRYRRTVWWLSAWLEARRNVWMPKMGPMASHESAGDLGYLFHGGGERVVWDTETYSRHGQRKPGAGADARLVKLFRTRLSAPSLGAVLVTSDRLSESVDLHSGCGTLVHFDLDWSPLRMMQRVGRLWRHSGFLERKTGGHRRVPLFPHVYHLRYPCSTDDEIYSRLQRRWAQLTSLDLGLDFISFESCLGREIGHWQEHAEILTKASSHGGGRVNHG